MPQLSNLAQNLIGSEIIKLNQVITEKVKSGEKIYNLTIGDFNPDFFPIPQYLADLIKTAYRNGHTNYPPADGIPELKQSILKYIHETQDLNFNNNEIMIAGGGRPLIYAIYKTIVDPGDVVIYPVPSWNNNHYCFLSGANGIAIETVAENGFLPTVEDIRPHIKDAVLLPLCSPSNPTGTMFSLEQLRDILHAVMEENLIRVEENRKPLYLMYDQIYSALHDIAHTHHDPVSILPEIRPYVIYVDGISKSLAATGLRLGWSFGPDIIISKMKSILGHIGAWAPKAEQVACSVFFNQKSEYELAFSQMNMKIDAVSKRVYESIKSMHVDGLPIDIIPPQGAIYLSVKFPIKGLQTTDGILIENTQDIADFLLNHAQLGIIPFTAFGCNDGTEWFRISVGTLDWTEIDELLSCLKNALQSLINPGR